MIQRMEQQPFRALYIHVPFCKQRCAYCDFDTEAVLDGSPEMRTYAENVCIDLMRASRAGQLSAIDTIYIGGGTPTYLDSSSLTQILYTISLTIPNVYSYEWTIEANPDSVNEQLVRDMWALGVNRVSVGVQSFNDNDLAFLGRIHSAQAARDAIECLQTRFNNISIDLMCGIPGQSLETFQDNLLEAIALDVKHISVYPLTVEEGTPLARRIALGACPNIDEDLAAECMERASDILHACGMQRYEVASYAFPGYECEHNKAYWIGVPYLGIGPGAVSMVQDAHERKRLKDGRVCDSLTTREALAEDAMLGMRMTCGLGPEMLALLRDSFDDAQDLFDSLVAQGFARWDKGRLVPTTQGWLCGNELYGQLLDLS